MFGMNKIFTILVLSGMSCIFLPTLRSEPPQASSVPIPPSISAEQGAIPERLVLNGQEVGHRVEPREGELCVICGKPITQGDAAYLVDGQRVSVHQGACLGALTASTAAWLGRFKPRGAFLDARAAQLGLSPLWLILGAYVLAGLIFGAFSAHRALSVGRNPMLWLAVGFLTNVVGFVVLLTMPRMRILAPSGVPAGLAKVSATYSPEACPRCGAENHPSARACSRCGAALAPRVGSEVEKTRLATR